MTIPFLDFLKKKPRPAAPAYVAAEKSTAERLSKTVVPNVTRTVGLQDSFETLTENAPTSAPLARPVVSFNRSAAGGNGRDLPPAVALALEPRVERTISIELADVLSQMPPGMTRPLADADATRHVLLKASEVEKGMASGKPSVSAWTVYQQVPEMFVNTITSEDTTRVQLPFNKVLEQFSKLHVRSDQNREQVVPQLETPFLKVTLEDDARFGTVTPAAQIICHELPPGRIEPATAETLAAAQPEAMATDKFIHSSTQFPAPKAPHFPNGNGRGTPQAPIALKSTPPAAIPYRLSPKGTDVPATERVPASSGPSVPTSAPTRIPFKITAPSDAARPQPDQWLTKENFAADETPADTTVAAEQLPPSEEKLTLLLKPILQSVLPLQLTREIAEVPEDAKVEIPCSLLAPQLASGRVCLEPEVFAQYLPDAYQELFDPTASAAAVALPLQEILKNLPGASLRIREDQIEEEEGGNFETPFSAKAKEDAERFKVLPAPPKVSAPAKTPVVEPSNKKEAAAAKAEKSPAEPTPSIAEEAEPVVDKASSPDEQKTEPPTVPMPESIAAPESTQSGKVRTALQTALETDEDLDAKSVVAHVTQMAGVRACAIMFGDGLSLAGNLPEQYAADGLCAMAPALLQRIQNHMVETKLGPLRAMTLFCAKAAVTFFMKDNLCLAAVHEQKELASDIRERLARVLLELSKKYSHPA